MTNEALLFTHELAYEISNLGVLFYFVLFDAKDYKCCSNRKLIEMCILVIFMSFLNQICRV
jgi:hypothetical protein